MAKMKLKTHSGAKKRFKLTKNGKIKRGHAFRSHILTKKTTKLTRGYRQPSYVGTIKSPQELSDGHQSIPRARASREERLIF